MKNLILILLCASFSVQAHAQSDDNNSAITRVCMNYIEGFYTGDTTLLIASLRPRLSKLGYWQNDDSSFGFQGYMTFDEALAFATKVKKSGKFAPADAPKEVKILDIGHTIAVAKVTARWGIDYLTLSRENGSWKIEQALWEGPLNRK